MTLQDYLEALKDARRLTVKDGNKHSEEELNKQIKKVEEELTNEE